MTLRYTVGQRLATMAPVRLRAVTGGFLPPQLGGCALWLDPSQGVFTDSAGSFASASSQSISFASDSGLQVGDIDFLINANVTFATVGASVQYIASKANGAGTRQWFLYKDSADKITFLVSSDGTAFSASIATSASVSAGVNYQVTAWHDSVANVIGLIVNGVATTPVSYSSGVYASGTAPFVIGAANGAQFLNGSAESVTFFKNIVGGFATTPAATIAAALAGLKPSQITPAQNTAWGTIIGALNNAQSSLVNDVIGGRTGTLSVSNPTVGAGAILTPAFIGANVSRWVDRAANIPFVQATYANRPTLQVVNGQLVVRFDGTNDFLLATGVGPYTSAYTAVVGVSSLTFTGFGRNIFQVSDAGSTALLPQLSTFTTPNSTSFCRDTAGTNSASAAWTATPLQPGVYTAIASLTNSTLRVNGIQRASSAGTLGATSCDRIVLGASTAGGNNFFGDMGAVAGYTRTPSVAEIQRIERFIATSVGASF